MTLENFLNLVKVGSPISGRELAKTLALIQTTEFDLLVAEFEEYHRLLRRRYREAADDGKEESMRMIFSLRYGRKLLKAVGVMRKSANN